MSECDLLTYCDIKWRKFSECQILTFAAAIGTGFHGIFMKLFAVLFCTFYEVDCIYLSTLKIICMTQLFYFNLNKTIIIIFFISNKIVQ
jgi:hypothetical protein